MPNPIRDLTPIDDHALDGNFWLVFGAEQYAVARFRDGGWALSSGKGLGFEPAQYRKGSS